MTAGKVGHEYTAYFLFTILYILLCKLRIGLVFDRHSVRISAGTPRILTDVSLVFLSHSWQIPGYYLDRPQPLPSKYFPVLSSKILPFGTVWSGYWQLRKVKQNADYIILQGGFAHGFSFWRYATIHFTGTLLMSYVSGIYVSIRVGP
jgi:hypothetical protein